MAASSTHTEVAGIAGVTIPSKWDVIPIHNSDRGTFKDCRRRWNWSSPARQNLTVRADVSGIYVPFFFGTGIHYALEQYYNPGLRRDPVEAFKTWFDIQWKGGVVGHDWLDKVYDLNPEPVETFTPGGTSNKVPVLWAVRGLQDILPDPGQIAEFDELYQLGQAMLTNYKRYAQVNDGFEVIAVEHDFSVPIWDYENNCILTAIDTREDSPNYGKRAEVHARGRQDMLYRKPNGRIGITDHKTADKIDSDLDAKLESDEQITTYLWAAEIEALYYDLPWKGEPLEEVIYNVLRKAAPQPPTIVRGGMFSVDRTKESCTIELLQAWMRDADVSYSDLDEKHQGYYDWLMEVGDEQFFVRKLVRRNRHQIDNIGKRIYLEALDMLSEPRIYPNLRKSWECTGCAFRSPCLALEAGEDYKYLLTEGYMSNRDR